MQIILEQNEIEQALIAYATSMIALKEDQDISIDMKAGRGENGYSATLDIRQKVVAAPVKATRAARSNTVSEGTVAVTQAAVAEVSAAPAKSGLFNKPAVVDEAPKEEPGVEEQVPGISTGEDRGEATEVVVEEAPVEKPKSIFNFQKPAANG